MAKLSHTHIATEYKDDFQAIPAGKYPMEIIKSEIVATKDGRGEIAKLQARVIEGQQANRIAFLQFNVSHPNEVAEAIGRKELNRIVTALGLDTLDDTEQLHGKPFIGTIAIDEGKDGYPARNKITAATPYVHIHTYANKTTGEKPRAAYTGADVAEAVSLATNADRVRGTNGKRSTPF